MRKCTRIPYAWRSKSELFRIVPKKHIVKCSIFGALCPSKSGLMNKHIVKHIDLTCARLSPD